MKIKPVYTSITYAGIPLLDSSNHLNEMESISLPRAYTTESVDIVDAASPLLDHYGNASGSFELATRRDYGSAQEALEALAAATEHADENQLGLLEIVVAGQSGDPSRLCFNAGLTEFIPSISKAYPDKFSLLLEYRFILSCQA